MKTFTTLTLTVKEIVQLDSEIRLFLRNNFSQYEKFVLNENLQTLKPTVKAYLATHDDLFKQYRELVDGQYQIKEIVKDKDGKWIVNENAAKFQEGIEPIEKEEKEVQLRLIPSKLLKGIDKDINAYELIYTYLINTEDQRDLL